MVLGCHLDTWRDSSAVLSFKELHAIFCCFLDNNLIVICVQSISEQFLNILLNIDKRFTSRIFVIKYLSLDFRLVYFGFCSKYQFKELIDFYSGVLHFRQRCPAAVPYFRAVSQNRCSGVRHVQYVSDSTVDYHSRIWIRIRFVSFLWAIQFEFELSTTPFEARVARRTKSPTETLTS